LRDKASTLEKWQGSYIGCALNRFNYLYAVINIDDA
jgi:hypothetical protein